MAEPKPTPVGPLTGILDLRSSPEELPRDALRMRQNLRTVGAGKLRRGQGYEKLLSKSGYNNSDFHDQLLSISGASIRQPVTMLFEAISTRKIRSLMIATQGTIAQLNAHTGNYRILGSGFGGTPSASAAAPRFHADRLGDYVVFTNDFDKVQYNVLEQAADDSGKFLHTIPDLDTIGLSRARVLWVWHNVVFLANVEMDGERAAYRMVWSDFDNPLGFDPADPQSITGSKDLYTHEEILAGAPLGNSFLIYTTHGIWEMIAVGGDQSFDFRRIYDGEKDNLKAVLAYENTLVGIHDAHAYLSRDGAYFVSQYQMVPERPEWLHRGTEEITSKIDAASCSVHVGAIYGDDIYFSIARTGATNQCPDYTLRVNKTYQAADVVDAGFTAFCQFSPQDIETIRDFIVESKICTLAGLASAGYGYGPEGLPRTLPTGTASFAPTRFYTTVTQSVSDGAGGTITIEDWNQSSADAASLCALLAGERLDEVCRACNLVPLLVAASSGDWCIKQLTDVFYREDCVNPTAVGTTDSNGYTSAVGSYTLSGLTSLLRFAAVNMPDSLLEMSQLEMKFLAVAQLAPLGISLRIGISAQPADPNVGDGIVWFQHSSQPLKFQSAKTMAEHLAANTIPAERAHWHFWRVGRFIHLELTIAGVGGDALFGSIEAVIRGAGQTRNF